MKRVAMLLGCHTQAQHQCIDQHFILLVIFQNRQAAQLNHRLTLYVACAFRYKPGAKEGVCVFRYFSLIEWLNHMASIASFAKAMEEYGGPRMTAPAGEHTSTGTV